MNLLESISISAEASGGLTYTETATIPMPSSHVLVMCSLNQVNQQGSNGQAQIAITSYVQGGNTNTGSWLTFDLDNITSVTFALTVTSAAAKATATIFTLP
jgi:hypothetical protein